MEMFSSLVLVDTSSLAVESSLRSWATSASAHAYIQGTGGGRGREREEGGGGWRKREGEGGGEEKGGRAREREGGREKRKREEDSMGNSILRGSATKRPLSYQAPPFHPPALLPPCVRAL